MRKPLIIAGLGVLMCSCAAPSLYNWKGYDDAVYAYTKSADEKSQQELIQVYENLIKNLGTSNKPAPGVCADYGYLLIKKGEKEKGLQLLKMEVTNYPESAQFINLIIKRVEK